MSSPVKTLCAEVFGAIAKDILNDFISHVNPLPNQLEAPNLEERQLDAFYADTFQRISGQHDEFVKKFPRCRTGEVLDRRLDAYRALNELKAAWLANRRAPHEILQLFRESVLADAAPKAYEDISLAFFVSSVFIEAICLGVVYSPVKGPMVGAFTVITGMAFLPAAAVGVGGVAIQSLVNSNSDLEYIE